MSSSAVAIVFGSSVLYKFAQHSADVLDFSAMAKIYCLVIIVLEYERASSAACTSLFVAARIYVASPLIHSELLFALARGVS